jgi:hypothetical protein
MPNLATVTPAKAAEMFNSGASGAPLEVADNLILGGITPNTNGAVFYHTISEANGGSGYATLTIATKDRMGLAPGATAGPAAQSFDVWVEVEENKTAYYHLFSTVGGSGTLLDSTFADGRFGATANLNPPKFNPKIRVRTHTDGTFTVRLYQYDIAGSVVNSDATIGNVRVIVYGAHSLAPLHRFGAFVTQFGT